MRNLFFFSFCSVYGKLQYLGNILLYVLFLGAKESRVTLRHFNFFLQISSITKLLNISD